MTFQTMLSTMATGMLRTCGIFVLTLIGSLPLGLLIYFARSSKNMIISGVTKAFIAIIRGTPLMLQLLVVYFGPYYLFEINIWGWRYPAIIVGFIIHYAA